MSLSEEAIGEVRIVNRVGQIKYGVKLNGKIIDAVISDSKQKHLEVHLGWLVRVTLRNGKPGIITGVVKRK